MAYQQDAVFHHYSTAEKEAQLIGISTENPGTDG